MPLPQQTADLSRLCVAVADFWFCGVNVPVNWRAEFIGVPRVPRPDIQYGGPVKIKNDRADLISDVCTCTPAHAFAEDDSAMLLGTALGTLGLARRFLPS